MSSKEKVLVITLAVFAIAFMLVAEVVDFGSYNMLAGTISKLISAFFFFVIMRNVSLLNCPKPSVDKSKNKTERLILLIIVGVVCVNNAPIIGLITGNVLITQDALGIVSFIFYCLAVALFEEILFRGVIRSAFVYVFEKNRYRDILAVLFSAVVFSIAHFSSFSIGVIVQMGYTLLLGFAWGYIASKEGHIWWGVLLHFIYNVGGMAVAYIGSGTQWDKATVVLTVIFAGLAVFIYSKVLISDIKRCSLHKE